jgi:DNA-binding CsgD family transcriptional regulator
MGRLRRYTVALTDAERTELDQFVSRGIHSSREITRARILLLVSEQRPDAEIVAALGISLPTISATAKRFMDERLGCLKERPRSGGPAKITPTVCAHITAIASTTPPEGYSSWTMQMIAGRIVETGILSSVSDESVRLVLKKNVLKPPSKATMVHRNIRR